MWDVNKYIQNEWCPKLFSEKYNKQHCYRKISKADSDADAELFRIQPKLD